MAPIHPCRLSRLMMTSRRYPKESRHPPEPGKIPARNAA